MEFLSAPLRGGVAAPRTLVWRELARAYPELVPPDPVTIPWRYRRPAPPLLSDGLPLPQAVCLVARAYAERARARLNQKVTFGEGDAARLLSGRHYMPFALGVQRLREHGLAPLAWIGYSLDRWVELHPGRKGLRAPALSWLFAPGRMAEQSTHAHAAYAACVPVLGPRRRRYAEGYARAKGRALVRLAAGGAAEPVLTQCFGRVRPAQVAAEIDFEEHALHAALTAAVARGAFIWT